MKLSQLLISFSAFICQCGFAKADMVIDFEELNTFTGTSSSGQYYNGNTGSSNSSGWTSNGFFFNNTYNASWDSWSGWSYSNVVNTTQAGYANQYASFPGGGADGSNNYAVAYGNGAYFNTASNTLLSSVSIANTTYSALSMQYGDSFAKKFGGTTGNDADRFELTFSGYEGLDKSGSILGSVTVKLSDFTFSDNTLDYILNRWQEVDLSPLEKAKSVSLSFLTTDVGIYGANTPLYIAFDNLRVTAVPEPSSIVLCGVAVVGFVAYRRKRLNPPGECPQPAE